MKKERALSRNSEVGSSLYVVSRPTYKHPGRSGEAGIGWTVFDCRNE